MDSEWRTLVNFTRYKIYREGLVFNLRRNEWVKLQIDDCGYPCVDLRSDDGGRRRFSIHRLLGLIWIPNPNNKAEINHKDGIKTNNGLDNLEWTTHAENIQHAWNNGLLKSTPERSRKN